MGVASAKSALYETYIVKLLKYISRPLYKTSFFIMITQICIAAFGFAFWILAAKFYTKEAVGIATALISSMSLIIFLSRLGLDQSIIKFSAKNDVSIYNTSIIITTFVTVIFGIIFVLGDWIWAPSLQIVNNYLYIFLIYLVAYSLQTIISTCFIALKKVGYYLSIYLVDGSRVFLLSLLISLGSMGIVSAMGIATILSASLSLFFLRKCGVNLGNINQAFLKESFNFSIFTYLAGLLQYSPNLILPLLVIDVLGAKYTAYYYIDYTIASTILFIPFAFSTSLFVEGCNGVSLTENTLKSILAIFLLLIPSIAILYYLSGHLLGFVGRDYQEGLDLLKILLISEFLISTNYIYFTVKKVCNDIRSLLLFNIITIFLLLGLCYVFMIRFGLIGIGYAFFSYGLVSNVLIISEILLFNRKLLVSSLKIFI